MFIALLLSRTKGDLRFKKIMWKVNAKDKITVLVLKNIINELQSDRNDSVQLRFNVVQTP